MEENNNIGIPAEETAEQPMTRRHYTKRQNFMYTIISVGLFFLLYFGAKGIMGMVNRHYYILTDRAEIAEELIPYVFEIGGISAEQGCAFESARLDKNEGGYTLKIIFSGIADEDTFLENGITFEYGNIEEDVRTEFYPDPKNPNYVEYVYADKLTDIEAPSRELYLFEWNGGNYAEYRQYSAGVPAEVNALFSGREKIYAES